MVRLVVPELQRRGVFRDRYTGDTLRDTLGSFAVQFVQTQRAPHTSMAAWLTHGGAPGRFALDQDLTLMTADGSKATVRSHIANARVKLRKYLDRPQKRGMAS